MVGWLQDLDRADPERRPSLMAILATVSPAMLTTVLPPILTTVLPPILTTVLPPMIT
jgi:uncharacterized membrane-anchored protein